MADPLPVDIARHIGQAHNHDVVLIVCFNQENNLFQTVSWGRDAQLKQSAAQLGAVITESLGVEKKDVTVHKDYLRAGEAAEQVDKLAAACRVAITQLGEAVLEHEVSDLISSVCEVRQQLEDALEDA